MSCRFELETTKLRRSLYFFSTFFLLLNFFPMRNLFFLFLVFFLSNATSFSQTTNSKPYSKEIVIEKNRSSFDSIQYVKTEKTINSLEKASAKTSSDSLVFQKNAFPKNQKASPAIFYVKNNQPIDQQQFMIKLKNASQKNKKP